MTSGRAYNALSAKAKRDHARAKLGGSDPVPCPACGVAVLPRELTQERHGARASSGGCRAEWLRARDVVALGVTKQALRYWVIRGRVRRRMRDGVWTYSPFDALMAIERAAARRGRHRSRAARRLAKRRWRAA